LDIVHTTRDGALSNNSRRHKQVIRYLQEHTFTHDNRRYLLQKYISLENLDVVLFNDIIFMLYDWYYVCQIDNLGIHASPINWDRGSKYLNTYTPYYISSKRISPKETWVCASFKSLKTLVSPPRSTFVQKDHPRE
jgi:hypothetical protein